MYYQIQVFHTKLNVSTVPWGRRVERSIYSLLLYLWCRLLSGPIIIVVRVGFEGLLFVVHNILSRYVLSLGYKLFYESVVKTNLSESRLIRVTHISTHYCSINMDR